MRSLLIFSLALLIQVSAQAAEEKVNKAFGTLVTDARFTALLQQATQEVQKEEQEGYYFYASVTASAKTILTELYVAERKESENVSDERMEELKVQADALAKLRVSKNFKYDRLVIGAYEVNKDEEKIVVTIQREDMHHYPPSFKPYRTIEAALKGGYGDFALEIGAPKMSKVEEK